MSTESTYADQFPTEHEFQSPDPNNPVWGFGGAMLIWVASMLMQIIFPLVFVIPFALHRGLNPASPDFVKGALELAISDPTAIFLQMLSILPSHILTFGLLWAFVTRFGRRPFLASLGLRWHGQMDVWLSVAGGIVLFGAATSLAKLLGAEKPTQMEQIINSSMAARYTIAVLAVFTAPFIEEFIYRGVLYSALQRVIGVSGAVVFVSGLFTAIHVPQYRENFGVIAAVALLSVVLTVVRARLGRLLPCIVIHMAFNGVQALFLVLEPYARRHLPSTEPVVPTISVLLRLTHLIF